MPSRIASGVFSAVLLSVLLTALPASAAARARVYVRGGPPAPIVEVRTAAPSARHVWIAGYHRWDGRVYEWVPGRWELPPRLRAVWVPGHWVHQRRGWYFVEGHWRG